MYFLVPVIIIGGLIWFFRWRSHRRGAVPEQPWYTKIAFSKEDAVSQLFILLGIGFLGVALYALNRDFGDPISGRTIFFLTSAAGIVAVYWGKLLYPLPFALLGLAIWWGVQAYEWTDAGVKPSAVVFGLFLVALLWFVLGRLHGGDVRYTRFAFVFTIFALISITAALFFLSTRYGIEFFQEITRGEFIVQSWEIFLSVLVLLIGLGVSLTYTIEKKLITAMELVGIIVLLTVFTVIALLPAQRLTVGPNYFIDFSSEVFTDQGWVWAVVLNMVLFFELVAIMLMGYQRREEWLINVGAIFLFLLIIVKYFDWFFTFLDKSLFFIGAGILLFVVGWFMEKGRRYMIDRVKDKSTQISQQL